MSIEDVTPCNDEEIYFHFLSICYWCLRRQFILSRRVFIGIGLRSCWIAVASPSPITIHIDRNSGHLVSHSPLKIAHDKRRWQPGCTEQSKAICLALSMMMRRRISDCRYENLYTLQRHHIMSFALLPTALPPPSLPPLSFIKTFSKSGEYVSVPFILLHSKRIKFPFHTYVHSCIYMVCGVRALTKSVCVAMFTVPFKLRILFGGARHMTNSRTAAVRWHWYCSSGGCDRYHRNSKVCKMYSIWLYFWSNFISASFFRPLFTIYMQHIHPFDLVCEIERPIIIITIIFQPNFYAVGMHTNTCTIRRQPNFAPHFFSSA